MNDELDEYLAGGSAVSRAYARLPRPEPPAALERAVLDELPLRRPLRSPCLAPLGLAATVVLSIAVLAALVLKPTPPREPSAARVMPVHYYRETEAQRPPGEWLDAIAALRRAGHYEEASAEMRRFRRAYPRFLVPGARWS